VLRPPVLLGNKENHGFTFQRRHRMLLLVSSFSNFATFNLFRTKEPTPVGGNHRDYSGTPPTFHSRPICLARDHSVHCQRKQQGGEATLRALRWQSSPIKLWSFTSGGSRHLHFASCEPLGAAGNFVITNGEKKAWPKPRSTHPNVLPSQATPAQSPPSRNHSSQGIFCTTGHIRGYATCGQ